MKVLAFFLILFSQNLYADINDYKGEYILEVQFGNTQFEDELIINELNYQSLWMGPAFNLHSSCFGSSMYQIKADFLSLGNFETKVSKDSCLSFNFRRPNGSNAYLYFAIEIDEGRGLTKYEFTAYLKEVGDSFEIIEGYIQSEGSKVGEFSGEKR